ncbi:MAG: hypothetical protein GWP75_08885, partial [Planctomycetia bacterium]|nr:hypothetical protein [Planctomycetia bacterium]
MTLPPRTISHARTTPVGSRCFTTTMFGIGLAILGVVAFAATAIGPIENTGHAEGPPLPTATDAVDGPAPDATADDDEGPRA